MLKNYFKVAWRNLIVQKSTTITNVLSLAIGLCACLIVYLITNFELSYDCFHPDKERIYRIVSVLDNPGGGKIYPIQIPYAAAMTIRREFTGIEKTANFFGYSAKVTIPNTDNVNKKFEESYPSKTIIPESSYFNIFRYVWLEGNAADALDQPFQIVLTEKRAHFYFGSAPLSEIIGKEMIYNDSLHLRVSGIVKDWDQPSDLAFTEFISFSTIRSSFLKDVSGFEMVTRPNSWETPNYSQNFVKLAKGTTPALFEQQTLKMIKEHMTHKEDWGRNRIILQPLSAIHFDPNYQDFYSRKTDLPTLYILTGIAAFILIIAAINFINLSTAQSLRRAKEIGIRKVLGSDRSKLVLQFLAETFLLTCFSAIFALLIVMPALRIFRDFIPEGVGLDLTKLNIWFFLAGAILFTSLLAGLYPAIVISSYQPLRNLKTKAIAGSKGYLRKGLIVFQFAISLLFIIGTIVIGSQSHYLLTKDMGFTKDAVISIQTSNKYNTNTRNILAEKIRDLPGVGMVSACRSAPMIDDNRPEGYLLQVKGNPVQKLECSERVGDEYYVPLFGLKIVAGRNFIRPQDDTIGLVPANSPDYTIASRYTEILINETCVRQLGFKTPQEAIGHIVGTPAPYVPVINGPIVGVVSDFHAQSLFSPIRPTYIYGSKNCWYGGVQVKLSLQNKDALFFRNTLAAIQKSWQEVYPNEPFAYEFLDQTIGRMYHKEQQTAQITNVAMIIAIILSCTGLFGLVTFTAAQRTKEIGIRKVLGASVTGIVILLSREFIFLVGVSIVIASPVAWYLLHQWLNDFAFRIKISWWIFALAGLMALLSALITVGLQALKAGLVNPINNLRTE